MALQGSLVEKAALVRDIYKQLDVDTAKFHAACGFDCGSCGHCCENPLIEVTELAMLPLALAVVEQGVAEDLYLLAEQQDFKGRCIFFHAGLEPGVRGHCGIYMYRPLICRLFGSSGNKDKSGHVRLLVCSAVKQAQPGLLARVEADLAAGRLTAPLMASGCGISSLPRNSATRCAVAAGSPMSSG